MAQKVQVLFEDDLDGSEAEGTVHFGIDGSNYEIDLSAPHADELRNVFAPYLAVARKVSVSKARRNGRVSRGVTTRITPTGPSNTEVREWAKTQGLEVKDRGRIPAELIVQFQSAQDQKAEAAKIPPVPPTPATTNGSSPDGDQTGSKPARKRQSKPKDVS